ncbi:U32 family peptidase [Clostridium butyricum]|uniref:U32 family peptidase n=2 Tax=Clostridium butyricum TaxID=1492 RepID=UPI001369013E|nr:U32 family peptidase [Clostridium butyricum]MZI82903.1 hypothetical protein [Clostridium butyricum]
MMKYYSVPADFKNSTIDGFAMLNEKYPYSKIIETYGQVTLGNKLGSGRSVDLLPEIDFEDLSRYVEYSKSKGINFNYTFNASQLNNIEFTEDGIKEIKKYLIEVYKIGIRSLTVALPSLFEIVKSTGLDFKIKTSAICQITNVNKAMIYKKMGADRIVVDETCNRDFEVLKNIREAYGEKVEIIVNAICYKDCIYRMFHYNQLSVDSIKVVSKASSAYYPNRCMLKRYENIGNILKLAWVRPEDIKHYENIGIQHFKIQGRHNVVEGDPIRAMECYFKESYDGGLLELMNLFASSSAFNVFVDNKKLDKFIEPFINSKDFCTRNCEKCHYCENYIKDIVDYEDARKVMDLSNEFYNDNDQFKILLKKSDEEAEKTEEENNVDIDFAF